ncbi:MAG: cyclic nucleotide-binding and patatin-like phospholipase domain-containing protein [Solirubrobacteraceae bacterium]
MPADRLAHLLDRLERRRYPAGATVIAQGDTTNEMYVVEAGVADIFYVDSAGAEHTVGRVLAGDTLGEMGLFTGQPASATVRASVDLELALVGESEFELLAGEFPVVYRNLGVILSERLARLNRLAARHEVGRLLLRDFGSPPLYGYALAASVAWHTRQRTMLLLAGQEPPDELRGLPVQPQALGAHTLSCELDAVDRTVDRLGAAGYDHVLVQVPGSVEVPAAAWGSVVHLADREGAAPREDASHVLIPAGPGDTVSLATGPVRVPAFSDSDFAALGHGFLRNTTPAGEAIGHAARGLTGLSVGLALGAGSVRGFAHIGVLRVLERIGLRPDYVAGTSIGAAAGAIYAEGHDPDAAAAFFDACGKTLVRYGLPFKGLLSSRAFHAFIEKQADGRRIEDLPIPLALVAADLRSGDEIVFRSGLLWQAMVASMSMPGIYPALRIGEHLVVDGAVLNPLPVSVAASMGAHVVIAVKLVGDTHRQTDAEAIAAGGHPPSAINVIMRSLELMQGRIATEAPSVRTITIAPDLGDLPSGKLRNFSDGQRFIDCGELAADAALPRITAALPWLRPEPAQTSS